MVPFHTLLKRLHDQNVEFVIIGGVAAGLHGSPVGTVDVDVVTPMSDENLERIHAAVHDLHARFRMRPDKMLLWDDPKRLHGFKNLYLLTDLGQIDFLGELPGICGYAELEGKSVSLDLGDFVCRVLDIDTLIAAKTVAGRPKDINGVYHLEAIRRRLRERGDQT